MQQFHYLHTRLESIADVPLRGLFEEIHQLREVPQQGLVIHFLTQSLCPLGKRRPFEKKEFSIEYYLQSKVRQWEDGEIYKLCIDLVAISGKHIEDYHGVTMYVFLNKVLKEQPKKKKRQPLF